MFTFVPIPLVAFYLLYWRGTSPRRAYRSGQLAICRQFADIDFRGKRTLIVDIENTLAERGMPVMRPNAVSAFERAWAQGVRVVCLLSNKKFKERGGSGDFSVMVEQLRSIGFDACLQQPRFGVLKWPRKPWRWAFRSARKRCGSPPKETILAVGDKFRFDVLRPIRMGWSAVLVNPLGSDGKGDRFMQIRRVENWTLDWFGLNRKGHPKVPQMRFAAALGLAELLLALQVFHDEGALAALFIVCVAIIVDLAVLGIYGPPYPAS